MPRVKIDGVRRLEDALIAASAGADFIGVVFVPNRRRRVSVEQGRRIVEAVKTAAENPPKVLGLFADQPLEEVEASVRGSGVDMVQFSGSESIAYCDQAPLPVFKTIHVSEHAGSPELEELRRRITALRDRGHMAVLDRAVAGLRGGTGQTFDWGVATRLSEEGLHFMLAGGLTPENVGDAVMQVNPWGVDVSSGVESRGAKDPEKVRRFIAEAKRDRP